METPHDYAERDYAEEPTLTLVLAKRSARLLAALLDSLVLMPVVLLGLLAAFAGSEAVGWMVGVAAAGAVAVYQLRLLSVEGQTIGKRALGLRIVMAADGALPGFVHAVVLRLFVMTALGMIPLVGVLVSLADPLFIFGEDRRCLHDYLAQTVVIQDGPGALDDW